MADEKKKIEAEIKKAADSVRSFDWKGFLDGIKKYDYKGLFERIKKFDYKNPGEYKKLFRDEKFRRRFYTVITIIFVILFLRGCVFKPPKPKIHPRPVTIAAVIKKDAPVYIDSFGTLTPISDVNIQSQVTGKVLEVHFTEGNEVANGDLLFLIDPSEYKADVDKAKATLAEDEAELKFKKDTFARNKPLVEKDLISVQDFESYGTNVEAGEAMIMLDRAALELAEINLGYCYIRSPIDGKTGKRLVDPGNIVTANTGSVLVNIKSVDPFYLDFTVSEVNLAKVRDAMAKNTLKVEISPEEDSSGPYEGELVFIDNKVDDLTGTVALRAIVSNKERKLWAGQFVLVKLILGIEKDATLAPEQAVRIGAKGHYLFIVTKQDKADLRILKVGQRQDDYIVIYEGVKPGDEVVTTGQLGLSPGVPVVDVTKKGSKKK